jgi:hypothetical protein
VAQFLLDVVFTDGVKGVVVKAQAAAAAAGTKLAAARKEATEVRGELPAGSSISQQPATFRHLFTPPLNFHS